MSWLFFAVLAQFILGTSAVFDRLLLKRPAFEPWSYTFWFGLFGLFAFVLAPFGFHIPGVKTAALALFSGAIFIAAMWLLFEALAKGKASSVLLFIGGLSPAATLALSFLFLKSRLGPAEVLGFILLFFAGIFLFLSEEKYIRARVFLISLASVVLLGFSNVLSKIVFDNVGFVSGFVWMKIGGALAVLCLLFVASLRKRIIRSYRASRRPHRALYMLNRGYAGLGSVFIFFAIFQTHPALVDATQSVKYVVIFFAAWFFAHEHFRGKTLLLKIIATLLVAVGLLWLGLVGYARKALPPVNPSRPIIWGVTFSSYFSRELMGDWKVNYLAILNDLKPPRLRLVAYWDDVERDKGKPDFSDLDFEILQARRANTKVILALGMKVPRWPECHIPAWAANLPADQREQELRVFMTEVVRRYRFNSEIFMWQVENEPHLSFGECPKRPLDFVNQEVMLVKSLDPKRPVLVTDSGELGLWVKAAREGDAFGTTMYREVYPRFIGSVFGIIRYPIPPGYFRIKEALIRKFANAAAKNFLVIELQGEPWGPQPYQTLSHEAQAAIFSPEYFKGVIEYAKATGFDEYYLWGGEWWYWLGKEYGDWRYWNIAKDIFR